MLTARITDLALATDPGAIDRGVRSALEAGRSLYTLDTERLRALRPDLILTQDLCSVCSIDRATVERVATGLSPRPEILCLNPRSLEEVLDDVVRIGRAAGLEEEARRELVRLRERFHRAADHVTPYVDGPSVAVLEWTDPLFVAGHWTPQLIERAGGRCPLLATEPLPGSGSGAGAQGAHRTAGASRRISSEELRASRPEALIISPCGVALDGPQGVEAMARALAREPWWGELPAVRAGRVALVDGNQMFSRPGPRLVEAFEWLVGWLNGLGRLLPPGFPWRPFA